MSMLRVRGPFCGGLLLLPLLLFGLLSLIFTLFSDGESKLFSAATVVLSDVTVLSVNRGSVVPILLLLTIWSTGCLPCSISCDGSEI